MLLKNNIQYILLYIYRGSGPAEQARLHPTNSLQNKYLEAEEECITSLAEKKVIHPGNAPLSPMSAEEPGLSSPRDACMGKVVV